MDEIKAGDTVKTPDGQGKVIAVAPPLCKVMYERWAWAAKPKRRVKAMYYISWRT